MLRQESLVLITPLTVTDDDPRRILKREPFIRYDRNHWGGRIVDLHLRKMKIRPCERYELDSLEAITILVSRGLGVSLIPDWLPPSPPRGPCFDNVVSTETGCSSNWLTSESLLRLLS